MKTDDLNAISGRTLFAILPLVLLGAISLMAQSTRSTSLPVRITEVWPAKICYRPGEKATFSVTLTNASEAAQRARLVCAVEGEVTATAGQVDEREVIHDEKVTIGPRGEKKLTLQWPTRGKEWGFDVVATLLDERGQTLDRRSDSFAVTKQNWRVGGGLTQWTVGAYALLSPEEEKRRLNTEVPEPYRGFPAFVRTGAETVAGARKAYGTHFEWYNWERSGVIQNTLHPESEDWLSGEGMYYMSKKKLLEVTRALQGQGIQVWGHEHTAITGPDGLEMMRRHPEWVACNEWGGADIAVDMAALTAWREGRPYRCDETPLWVGASTPVLITPETVDFHADAIIAGVKMFGWDGFRSDGAPLVWADTYWQGAGIGMGAKGYRTGFRYDGELVCVDTVANTPAEVNREMDERTVELYERFKGRIRKACPDFQFAVNPLCFPESGFFEQTHKSWCAGGYLLGEGLNALMEPGAYYNVWTNFIQRLQQWRDHTRTNDSMYQCVLFLPDSADIVAGRFIASAIIRASQTHPLYVIGPASHARFALRYSRLIAAPDVERIRADVANTIKVVGQRGIWWQPFVYRRNLGGGHRQSGTGKEQLIVHLLNEPNKPNYDKTDPAPPVQENVRVSFKLPQGKRLEKVWALNADTMESKALEAKTVGEWATVSVPRLEYWSVVVWQCQP